VLLLVVVPAARQPLDFLARLGIEHDLAAVVELADDAPGLGAVEQQAVEPERDRPAGPAALLAAWTVPRIVSRLSLRR